jgi:hypothetical protein
MEEVEVESDDEGYRYDKIFSITKIIFISARPKTEGRHLCDIYIFFIFFS